jgi:hypothetical protein
MHDTAVEEELQKSTAELTERPFDIEEPKPQQNNVTLVEDGPSQSAPTDQQQFVPDEPAHSHFEQNEHLPNGHTVHTVVDEWKQANGGDGEIRRIVEEERYEVQNEVGEN